MAEMSSIAAITTELQTDPARLGYAPAMAAGDHNTLFGLLNSQRAGGGFLVNRDPVVPEKLFAEIEPADFEAMTVTELTRLQVLMTLPRIDLADVSTKAIVDGLFVNGALTRQNVAVLQKRAGSRAEVLFGEGTIVTLNQIAQALA